MARIKNNGTIEGLIGQLIMYERSGQKIIRRRTEKRKDTSKEIKSARTDFGQVIQQLKKIRPLSDIGFAATKTAGSSYHAALSANLISYRDSKQTGEADSYSWIRLSDGTLPGSQNLEVIATADGNIRVTWKVMDKGAADRLHDHAFAGAIVRSTGKFYHAASHASRGDGQLELTLKDVKSGDITDVFVFFAYHESSAKGITNASPSHHVVCAIP